MSARKRRLVLAPNARNDLSDIILLYTHPTSRIVVIGGVTPDAESVGLTVEMVLLGGKHRPLTAFRALVHEVGLDVKAAGRLPSGRFAVECRPF